MTNWGQNVLYRNLGNGTFHDETESRGLEQTTRRWSTGCTLLTTIAMGAWTCLSRITSISIRRKLRAPAPPPNASGKAFQ